MRQRSLKPGGLEGPGTVVASAEGDDSSPVATLGWPEVAWGMSWPG